MNRTLSYLNFILVLISFHALKAQIPKSEKEALTELYNATTGDQWTNSWNLNTPPTEWYGVTIEDNHVTEVNLTKNNLQGIIPEGIKNLKNVEVLDLSFNKLTGDLPFEIVKCEELKVLRLEMNRIKGTIPKMIGRLSNLEELVVYNNMFEGPIPESIGEAKKMKVLNLSSNFLIGNLPVTMANLSNLERLELFGNKLDGAIELDLGKLKHLSLLVLSYNNFEGAVPSGMEKLDSLKFVQLQGNGFNSFEALKDLNTNRLATFECDDVNLNRKYNPVLNSKATKTADTKFENDN